MMISVNRTCWICQSKHHRRALPSQWLDVLQGSVVTQTLHGGWVSVWYTINDETCQSYLLSFSKQASQTRTSFSMPNLGTIDVLDEHLLQKIWPHARQWCYHTQTDIDRHTDTQTYKHTYTQTHRCTGQFILGGWGLNPKIFSTAPEKTAMLTCKITLPNSPHPTHYSNYQKLLVKIPDFGNFISLDRMNSVFSFNKYKKYFSHFWLLASAEKFSFCPSLGGGGYSPPSSLAHTPMQTDEHLMQTRRTTVMLAHTYRHTDKQPQWTQTHVLY